MHSMGIAWQQQQSVWAMTHHEIHSHSASWRRIFNGGPQSLCRQTPRAAQALIHPAFEAHTVTGCGMCTAGHGSKAVSRAFRDSTGSLQQPWTVRQPGAPMGVCIISADFWGLSTAGGTATAYHLLAQVPAIMVSKLPCLIQKWMLICILRGLCFCCPDH